MNRTYSHNGFKATPFRHIRDRSWKMIHNTLWKAKRFRIANFEFRISKIKEPRYRSGAECCDLTLCFSWNYITAEALGSQRKDFSFNVQGDDCTLKTSATSWAVSRSNCYFFVYCSLYPFPFVLTQKPSA